MKLTVVVILFICCLNAFSTVVYVTQIKSEADKIVFIDTCQTCAGLLVYKTNIKSIAENNGNYWYFTNTKNEAGMVVYISNIKSEADIKVYFIKP